MSRTRSLCPPVSGLSAQPDMARLSARARSVRNGFNNMKYNGYFPYLACPPVSGQAAQGVGGPDTVREKVPPFRGDLSRPGHAPDMPSCPQDGRARHAIPSKADPQDHG